MTIQTGGSVEEQRRHLFKTYVDRMFTRRKVRTIYTQPQTMHWLAWLAIHMVQHSQTVFYIEQLQPDWLSDEQQSRFGLISGLIGVLIIGPVGMLPLALFFGLIVGNLAGLVFGLVFGLGYGLIAGNLVRSGGFTGGQRGRINIAETVRWSWPKGGLVGRLGIGLGVGLSIGLGGKLDDDLSILLFFGLVVGLGYLFEKGLFLGEVETKTDPNQGIRRSARNALVSGLSGGLVVGLGVGLAFGLVEGLVVGLLAGLLLGLFGGLLLGLASGGSACCRHLAIRFLLARNDSAPWNYPAFLDSAAERLFLRKVGGGYTFIHRMLMEYFAALDAAHEQE